MRQYEQTLNKITPILYKFSNYRSNLTVPVRIIWDYLKSFEVPQEIAVDIPTEYVNYIYAIKFIGLFSPLTGKASSDHIIWLTKKDKISEFWRAIIDEFIVNMVINKFSFEKLHIFSLGFLFPQSYKDLFIALVGKDTYETIRKNIK
jgi:hypothetical protein